MYDETVFFKKRRKKAHKLLFTGWIVRIPSDARINKDSPVANRKMTRMSYKAVDVREVSRISMVPGITRFEESERTRTFNSKNVDNRTTTSGCAPSALT